MNMLFTIIILLNVIYIIHKYRKLFIQNYTCMRLLLYDLKSFYCSKEVLLYKICYLKCM